MSNSKQTSDGNSSNTEWKTCEEPRGTWGLDQGQDQVQDKNQNPDQDQEQFQAQDHH